MSDRAPYSRVYWSVMDDPKFDGIREDVRLFGSWVLLLVVADMAHPAPAYLPRTVPKAAIDRLVKAGLVDPLPGHRFRIHGLEAERTRRRAAASTGPRRDPNGTQTGPERDPNGSQAKQSREEQSKDEAENEQTRAPDDPWDDPEHEALVWLAKHGCDIRPGNGYHRKLVTAVEVYGVNAVVGAMDRLADAGTRQGDVKGFLFGAIDMLTARDRPKLADLAKEERVDETDRAHQARLERTCRETADLRAVLERTP